VKMEARMNMNSIKAGLAVVIGCASAVASFAQSGDAFAITSSVIAGGGGTSTGGAFSVTGTLGQPAAGGLLSGGPFALSSGFWSAIQTPGAPTLQINSARAGRAVFSWAADGSWRVLQQTADLNTAFWDKVSASLVVADGANRVTLPVSPGNRFFRLSPGTLGEVVARRYCGLMTLIPESGKHKLALASSAFQQRVNDDPQFADFEIVAREELSRQFGTLEDPLANKAVFYLLADVLRPSAPQEQFDCDSELETMAESAVHRLQIAADRRSALLQILSNILHRIQKTNDSLVLNLK
jgi:hypothetical protein